MQANSRRSAWACVCVLLGIQVVAGAGAYLVLQRKFRKLLLTQQDAEAAPSCPERLFGLLLRPKRGRGARAARDAAAPSSSSTSSVAAAVSRESSV